jgi:type I restriction enzyme S subunit
MDFAGLQDPMCGNPLPTGWKLMRLGDLGNVRYGLGQPPEQSADGVPMVRATNVKRGRLVSDGLIRIKREAIPESRNPYLCAGEIIVVRSGAYTGDVAMVTHDWAGSVVGYDLVFSSKEQVDPAFCAAVLLSDPIQSFFLGERDRSAQPHLNRQQLESTAIPVPPVDEQRKIAAVLGLVQRAIEQQERLIALTTELKKALLHKLFTEGLRGEPQKQTEIGPVPRSWEVVRLDEVCTLLSGGTPSKQKQEFWTGSIPWVSPKDMKKPRLLDVTDHISQAALEDGSSLAPAGSVFVVIRGMILAKDVPVALAEVPMAFNQDMKAIIAGPRVVPSFLLYGLVAFKQNLFQKVGRSAHGTMTLMSSELEQFSIPLPDRQTQEEIATEIQTVEHKHEIHRRKHAVLADLFRTLLHQLTTAQIRVHNLEIPEVQRVIDEPDVGLRCL